MSPEDFDVFWRFYCESFPETERRSRRQLVQLLNRPEYAAELLWNNGEMTGFWDRWEFGEFLYVEHIAYAPEYRGKGLGRRFFRQLMASASKPIVLEVERDDSPERIRRIRFYEGIGMHLNRFPYVQPPLQPGLASVPMFLFSWPEPLTAEAYDSVKARLYRSVYGVPADWHPPGDD